jgi:hypothetical protein
MAADGQSGSGAFAPEVNRALLALFREFTIGLLTDHLDLANHLRGNAAAAAWIEQHYRTSVEQMAGLVAVWMVGEALASNAEQINLAVVRARNDAEVAFARERIRAAARRDVRAVSDESRPSSLLRDFFISDASEDQDAVARPLAEELEARGRTVWFSGFELTLGDSLRARLDDGLATIRYGVVVLSPSFFDKPWPTTELNALGTRAMNEGRKVILPVWHNVTKDDVRRHSPILADMLGVETSRGLTHVADEIVRALRSNR